MKCTNNFSNKIITITICIAFVLSGCSSSSIVMPYDPDMSNNSYTINSGLDSDVMAKPFATNLCVADSNVNEMVLSIENAEAGGLFDISTNETLYAKNIHERKNPASLTKVMTAYVALKYGHLTDTLTASENVRIKESGAQLLGLAQGDKMTLEQALNVLMIYSANDVAVMIAEYISGNVDSFCALMNDEAKKLGATNTNFTNPNGLTDDNHYTTAYDLYLIFNAALGNDEFVKIISTNEYKSTYTDQAGNVKNIDITNTNGYLKGDYSAPENVTVIGGKTGTTNAAGSCLILLSNSTAGDSYVSIVLHSTDHATLYEDMNTVLSDIP